MAQLDTAILLNRPPLAPKQDGSKSLIPVCKRGQEGGNVRSASTPLRVNNKVPLKMSRMYWNSRDQMHFLGLEYCKKNFSKKSFRNLKKGHWILVIVQLLGLMWQLVRSCAEPRRFVFVLQTANCGAPRRQSERTSTFTLVSLLMVMYKLLWLGVVHKWCPNFKQGWIYGIRTF